MVMDDVVDDVLLTEEEYSDLNEADPIVQQITYSGQDFDIEGLVRRLEKGDIVIPRFGRNDPTLETVGFQRGFVWRKPQMDRFIESLLLGFPIPGIFLVRQVDRRYLVLDGQQRLLTLKSFYGGVHQHKEFSLTNVSDKFLGLTYAKLPNELRRTLDDAFIQATIVNLDGSRSSLESVYQIFERLNSGGTQLTPHEIRIALHAGKLVEELERLNNDPRWRKLYGAKSPRVRDQELILRIIALYVSSSQYSRPLKSFLNRFMDDYRDANDVALVEAMKLFMQASDLLLNGPGTDALRKASRQVNAAQTEAIYVGLMRRLSSGAVQSESVRTAVHSLRNNSKFDSATGKSTADDDSVATRLEVATATFADVS